MVTESEAVIVPHIMFWWTFPCLQVSRKRRSIPWTVDTP